MAEKKPIRIRADEEITNAYHKWASDLGWSASRIVNDVLRAALEHHGRITAKIDRAAFDKLPKKSPPVKAGLKGKIQQNR